MALITTGSSGNSGSSSSTATATVTTDPNTFVAPPHVFDLGTDGPHLVQVTLTGLVLTPDGETFGNDSGMIYAGPESTTTTMQGSADGVIYNRLGNGLLLKGGDDITLSFEIQTLAITAILVVTTGRYVKVPMAIVSNDGGSVYAGANHPAAQIKIDLVYT